MKLLKHIGNPKFEDHKDYTRGKIYSMTPVGSSYRVSTNLKDRTQLWWHLRSFVPVDTKLAKVLYEN